MSEEVSMDDILSDAPPPEREIAPPVGGEPEPDAPAVVHDGPKAKRKEHLQKERDARAEGEGKIRDPETGKYVPKEPVVEKPPEAAPAPVVAPVVPPSQDLTPKERAFLAQAADERRKRQELEQRLAALESPKEPAKTFWEDPEGHLRASEQRNETLVMNTRLNTAEVIARSKYPDFDEKVGVFAEVMRQTPGLHQQWLAALDPAEFAYRTGKNHQEYAQIGNLDALKTKIVEETTAKVRAQVEAEYKDKADAKAKERAALPRSLSDAHATGINRPVWGGPPTFDSILKGD